MLEEKTAQNAIKTKLQQERHREERRQLLQQTSGTTKFAQMSDFEQQLRVLKLHLLKHVAILLICIVFQDIEAQYASSAESSDSDRELGNPTEESEEITPEGTNEIRQEGVEETCQDGIEETQEETECNVAEDESDDFDEDLLDLYCPACKKNFKTIKS